MAADSTIHRMLSLLLALSLLLGCVKSQVGTVSQDIDALKSLKRAWGNPSSLSDWIGDEPCSAKPWTGVICEKLDALPGGSAAASAAYYVNAISLVEKALGGFLSPALGSFYNLQTIDLTNNMLSGPIPTNISNLSNLKILRLGGNRLNGSFPRQIILCHGLEEVNVRHNLLIGILPRGIGGLTNLQKLHFARNRFIGPIPLTLGNLRNLSDLDLAINNLTGPIPAQLGKLKNLQSLSLSANLLSGPIPDELSTLPKLQNLYLNRNRLNGSIPASLGNLTDLRTLIISDNLLSGEVPVSLAHLSRLRLLMAVHNQLQGTIGPEFKKFYRGFSDNPELCIDKGDHVCHKAPPRAHVYVPPPNPNITKAACAQGQVEPCECADGKHGQRVCVPGQGFLPCECRDLYFAFTDNSLSTGWIIAISIAGGMVAMGLVLFVLWATRTNLGRKKAGGWEYSSSSRSFPDASAYRSSAYDPDEIDSYPASGSGYYTKLPKPQVVEMHSGDNTEMAFARKFGQSMGASSSSLTRFSYEDLHLATNNFSHDNVVNVDEANLRTFSGILPDGSYVSIRELPSSPSDSPDQFIAAVDVFSLMHHPNLAQVLGFCVDGSRRLLVSEIVANGSLDLHLHESSDFPVLDWNSRMAIALGVAKGLDYLHRLDPQMTHQNLRTSNVLLDDHLGPKLSDYCLQMLSQGQKGGGAARPAVNQAAVAAGITAPELAWSDSFTPRTDTYAFGVLLLQLVTGRAAMDVSFPKNEQSLVRWAKSRLSERSLVESMVDPCLGAQYSNGALYQVALLASQCIQPDPETRPAMAQALQVLNKVQALPIDSHGSHHGGGDSGYASDKRE